METMENRVAQVKENIARAMERAGRTDEVTLVAAIKMQSVSTVKEAIRAGIAHGGENKVQELQEKYPEIGQDLQWHFIGQLQSNKVKYIIDKVIMIHSVDRLSLAREISKRALAAGRVMPVLIQVNIGREAAKGGVDPDEAEELIRQAAELPGIRICGLMTVPPAVETAEQARPYFRRMRELLIQLQSRQIPGTALKELSMGMSHDYEVAVEEGATMVRVGTVLFGQRNYH